MGAADFKRSRLSRASSIVSQTVDVWIGRFRSRAAYSAYFSEEFDEEAVDRPISPFAADLGQPFYDHDALETSYHGRWSALAEMIGPHSGAASFLAAAEQAFEQLDWGKSGGRPNTLVLAYNGAIDKPVSIERAGYRLVYLGRFPCDLSVGPAPGDAGPPTGIVLTVTQGGPVTFGGQSVTVIPVDARGLILGAGGVASDDRPRLDLSAFVPGIAERQLAISRDQFDQWQIEELAGNDLVRFRGQEFSRGRAFPWHGQRLTIGTLEFEWTVE